MSDSFKEQILDKIKFVFDDTISKLTESINQKEIVEQISNLNEGKKEEMDKLLGDLKEKENDSGIIFKKIKILFNVIGDLIKYSIIQVDDPQYQKVESEKIICPETIDKLIVIMGVYSKAFNRELEETFYKMVNLPYYQDLYKISSINFLMIPFVADDNIDSEKLMDDYKKFSYVVRNLVYDILGVTDFEEDTLFE